jgi:hypothetical protein
MTTPLVAGDIGGAFTDTVAVDVDDAGRDLT